jgi:hypothetical protein
MRRLTACLRHIDLSNDPSTSSRLIYLQPLHRTPPAYLSLALLFPRSYHIDLRPNHHASPALAAVSPFRQRALKGTLHGYIFNGYSRAMRQAPYMLIPFGIGA